MCPFAECVVTLADQSFGKTPLMKALLHLVDGKNDTVELLICISEQMGDVKKFVNLAYTNIFYQGKHQGDMNSVLCVFHELLF